MNRFIVVEQNLSTLKRLSVCHCEVWKQWACWWWVGMDVNPCGCVDVARGHGAESTMISPRCRLETCFFTKKALWLKQHIVELQVCPKHEGTKGFAYWWFSHRLGGSFWLSAIWTSPPRHKATATWNWRLGGIKAKAVASGWAKCG